jgi:putative nucleotidyltransferase with HDIG domain
MELTAAVAEALEKTRLLRENIRMKTLMPLFEVSKEIISEIDVKKLFTLILDIAVRETHADRAFLCIRDHKTGEIVMEGHHGISQDFFQDFQKKYREKIEKIMMLEKLPLLTIPEAGLPDGIEEIITLDEKSSSIYSPLTIRGNYIGALFLSRTAAKYPFTSSEVEFVSVLSGQAAAAIENARLYEKIEQSYLSLIVTLSGVVEAKDLYTDKHMKDIAEYSVAIAHKLNLEGTVIENIRKAALLHDIGKIGIPDHILLKPDKLSDEEMDIIKKHPLNGAKLLEAVEPIRDAKDIIRHHHEFFDGSGYPDGLKGEMIPLGARIVAVADAFGAMTTTRPYRKALSIDEAIQEIQKFSGVQFDPHIVEIFISLLDEKRFL